MNITKILKSSAAMAAAAAMTAVITISSFTASAELSNTAVNADKSGILQVEVHYKQDQEDLLVQTGTGFLINQSTLLTCDHVITIDEDDKSLIAEYMTEKTGEEQKFDPDYVKVQIAILGDVKEDATITRESAEADYAILTINQTLTTKTPLKLSDSDKIEQTQEVYALGFPAVVTDFQSHTNYTAYVADDVTVTKGTVSKTNYVFNDGGNTRLIQHSANISEGNSGGPLVNANGAVVGINRGVFDNFYYAIEINQIRELLDTLAIEYTTDDGDISKPAVTTAENSSQESSQEEEATHVSVAPATSAASVPQVTVPPITTEKKSNILIFVVIGIIVFVIIIIAIIIALIIKSSKKPTPVAGNVPFTPAAPPMNQMNPMNQMPQAPRPQFNNAMTAPDAGAGETSLLNEGAGETSILGGGVSAASVSLFRKKTGTNIPLSSPVFIIGKENSKVNYCVNNNAVSRQHAKFTVNGGKTFVTDMNSSNFTYINGRKIPANTPQELHNGDVVKLADEEFEFRG